MFSYCWNNPINYIDKEGESPVICSKLSKYVVEYSITATCKRIILLGTIGGLYNGVLAGILYNGVLAGILGIIGGILGICSFTCPVLAVPAGILGVGAGVSTIICALMAFVTTVAGTVGWNKKIKATIKVLVNLKNCTKRRVIKKWGISLVVIRKYKKTKIKILSHGVKIY